MLTRYWRIYLCVSAPKVKRVFAGAVINLTSFQRLARSTRSQETSVQQVTLMRTFDAESGLDSFLTRFVR